MDDFLQNFDLLDYILKDDLWSLYLEEGKKQWMKESDYPALQGSEESVVERIQKNFPKLKKYVIEELHN